MSAKLRPTVRNFLEKPISAVLATQSPRGDRRTPCYRGTANDYPGPDTPDKHVTRRVAVDNVQTMGLSRAQWPVMDLARRGPNVSDGVDVAHEVLQPQFDHGPSGGDEHRAVRVPPPGSEGRRERRASGDPHRVRIVPVMRWHEAGRVPGQR